MRFYLENVACIHGSLFMWINCFRVFVILAQLIVLKLQMCIYVLLHHVIQSLQPMRKISSLTTHHWQTQVTSIIYILDRIPICLSTLRHEIHGVHFQHFILCYGDSSFPKTEAELCHLQIACHNTQWSAPYNTCYRTHGAPAFTYKGLKIEYCSTNNVEYKFQFCHDDIKCCVSGNNKYILDWHVVPNTWLVKIGANLSRQDVLVLEDVVFQLEQREAL